MADKNKYEKKAVLDTFKIMYSVEIEISRLYSAFAGQFPEDSGFWKKISSDEVVHGDNIKRIFALLSENDLEYTIGKAFSLKAGSLMLENVRLYINDTEEKLLTKKNTLVIARDLENCLLEAKYMDYLITDHKEYNDFIKLIVKETTQHKALIEKKLKESNLGV